MAAIDACGSGSFPQLPLAAELLKLPLIRPEVECGPGAADVGRGAEASGSGTKQLAKRYPKAASAILPQCRSCQDSTLPSQLHCRLSTEAQYRW